MTAGGDGFRAEMAWVEIDHDAIAHNVRTLVRAIGPSRLWAVVKGQGYGHGAPEVARTALAAGAAGLTVSSVAEALALREAGVEGPLFVMNPLLPEHAALYVRHRLIAAVDGERGARALSDAAVKAGAGSGPIRSAPVHVKVDTGLGRFGARRDVPELLRRLGAMPGLRVEGVFSHFAAADAADLRSARAQLATFDGLLRRLEAEGLRPPVAHIGNSPGTLALPEARYDMVRNGLSIYGMYSSPSVRERAERAGVGLKPALALRARAASVRRLPAGHPVGYGGVYVTDRETTVVTLPVGYSNGVSRNLTGQLEALVAGRRRPVVGRVCMNHVMVDAGDLPVDPGDVVTLLGRDGDERITVEQWADRLGTIAYEIVCMVGNANPRRHRAAGPATEGE